MKQVIKLIEQHCNKTQTDRHNGLEALLDYMIEFFDIMPFVEDRYEEHVIKMKSKSAELFEIVLIFMNKVTEAIEKGRWLDFFGHAYYVGEDLDTTSVKMYRLEPELTKIRYTEEEMRSLKEGVKVLSYTWGDPVNLFGSAIDATNDYADTFPTLAEKMNYKKVEEETMKNL